MVVEHLRDLRATAAVEGDPGGEQDVEEAEVLEAGLVVAVADGVVEAGRALERRLAVERGVDPGRDRAGGGEEVGLDAAGAELQVVLGLGDRVGRGQPVGGRVGLRELDVHLRCRRARPRRGPRRRRR